MTRPWSRRRSGTGPGRGVARSAAVWLAIGAVALGLSGCAAARNELGTVDSDCYVTLPTAVNAVHHHGKLKGVRLVSVASLRTHAPVLYDAALDHGKRSGNVCLVAFAGTFLADEVSGPVGRRAGHIAVVELSYPEKRLLATMLLRHPPIPFGHTRI
jgi:hypothetical protein